MATKESSDTADSLSNQCRYPTINTVFSVVYLLSMLYKSFGALMSTSITSKVALGPNLRSAPLFCNNEAALSTFCWQKVRGDSSTSSYTCSDGNQPAKSAP